MHCFQHTSRDIEKLATNAAKVVSSCCKFTSRHYYKYFQRGLPNCTLQWLVIFQCLPAFPISAVEQFALNFSQNNYFLPVLTFKFCCLLSSVIVWFWLHFDQISAILIGFLQFLASQLSLWLQSAFEQFALNFCQNNNYFWPVLP